DWPTGDWQSNRHSAVANRHAPIATRQSVNRQSVNRQSVTLQSAVGNRQLDMGFVAPLILVGLGALAIPVLIHLIQREKKRVVEFPSLMFLRRIPYQSVRRRRIRNWALLLMRAAALALIVMAFARPFFRRSELAAAAQNGAREAVILVDTSYSMDYGDRWAKAKTAASNAIRGLSAGDRASLVLFSSGAEVAV